MQCLDGDARHGCRKWPSGQNLNYTGGPGMVVRLGSGAAKRQKIARNASNYQRMDLKEKLIF